MKVPLLCRVEDGGVGWNSITLPTHQQPLKLLTRTPRVPRAQLENLSSQEILLTGDPQPALQLNAFDAGLLLPRPWGVDSGGSSKSDRRMGTGSF